MYSCDFIKPLEPFAALAYRAVISHREIPALHLAIKIVPVNKNSMKKITDSKRFNERIIKGKGLQIIRFCAAWSGPCQIMRAIYEELSVEFKNSAAFYKVDVDEAQTLKRELGIKKLPAIFFYKNGVLIDFVVGLISRELLHAKFIKLITGK